MDDAKDVLEKCGTDTGDIEEEIQVIQKSLDIKHYNLQEHFFQKKYRYLLVLKDAPDGLVR